MKTKIIVSLVVVLVAVLSFVLFHGGMESDNSKPKLRKDRLPFVSGGFKKFEFTSLPEDIVAKVGDLTVSKKSIMGPQLKDLYNQKNAVLIALTYAQFAKKGNTKNLTFHSPAPSRPLDSILNQYGVEKKESINVTFKEEAGKWVSVDGKAYQKSEIDTAHINWYAINTRLFQYQLKAVEDNLRSLLLYKLAKDKDVPIQEFIQKEILSKYPGMKQERAVSKYMDKNIIQYPIQVNLNPPNYNWDLNYDWTPSLGAENSYLQVLVFVDFFNSSSQAIISQLQKIHQAYSSIYLGVRPYFPKKDRLQKLVADSVLCVWGQNRQNFWDYLRALHSISNKDTENKIYEAASRSGVSESQLKVCLVERPYAEAVDYHLKYGDYIGIQNSPVVFIGGEVLTGAVSIVDIEKTIARRLEVPVAGVQ